MKKQGLYLYSCFFVFYFKVQGEWIHDIEKVIQKGYNLERFGISNREIFYI